MTLSVDWGSESNVVRRYDSLYLASGTPIGVNAGLCVPTNLSSNSRQRDHNLFCQPTNVVSVDLIHTIPYFLFAKRRVNCEGRVLDVLRDGRLQVVRNPVDA